MEKYQARAAVEGVDALGYYMVPWAYSQLQILQQAVVATSRLTPSRRHQLSPIAQLRKPPVVKPSG
jgi:hypothetical protein